MPGGMKFLPGIPEISQACDSQTGSLKIKCLQPHLSPAWRHKNNLDDVISKPASHAGEVRLESCVHLGSRGCNENDTELCFRECGIQCFGSLTHSRY